MSKPLRLQIADAILDYLHKHHDGDFRSQDLDRYRVDWIDTGPVDVLDLVDSIIQDASLKA